MFQKDALSFCFQSSCLLNLSLLIYIPKAHLTSFPFFFLPFLYLNFIGQRVKTLLAVIEVYKIPKFFFCWLGKWVTSKIPTIKLQRRWEHQVTPQISKAVAFYRFNLKRDSGFPRHNFILSSNGKPHNLPPASRELFLEKYRSLWWGKIANALVYFPLFVCSRGRILELLSLGYKIYHTVLCNLEKYEFTTLVSWKFPRISEVKKFKHRFS